MFAIHPLVFLGSAKEQSLTPWSLGAMQTAPHLLVFQQPLGQRSGPKHQGKVVPSSILKADISPQSPSTCFKSAMLFGIEYSSGFLLLPLLPCCSPKRTVHTKYWMPSKVTSLLEATESFGSYFCTSWGSPEPFSQVQACVCLDLFVVSPNILLHFLVIQIWKSGQYLIYFAAALSDCVNEFPMKRARLPIFSSLAPRCWNSPSPANLCQWQADATRSTCLLNSNYYSEMWYCISICLHDGHRNTSTPLLEHSCCTESSATQNLVLGFERSVWMTGYHWHLVGVNFPQEFGNLESFRLQGFKMEWQR